MTYRLSDPESVIREALLTDNSGGYLDGEGPLLALEALSAEVRHLREVEKAAREYVAPRGFGRRIAALRSLLAENAWSY